MTRPLYKSISPHFHASRSNAGLWYDKFCDRWPNNWGSSGQIDDGQATWKSEWVRNVAGTMGDGQALNEFASRQRELVRQIGGLSLSFNTTGRFVTGLGRKHPVENGFAWHPTLGTPYLPGSSIKGLIRAWAQQWEGADSKSLDEILGPYQPRETGAERVGSVIFFDAIPYRPVRLELDVMTPHYGEYYQNGQPPGDWLNPTPIPFLVVAKDQPFQFSFAPRSPEDVRYLQTVETWLKQALEWLGAGAKTAVGYGRFQHDPQKDRDCLREDTANRERRLAAAALEAELALLSPALKQLVEQAEAGQWLSGNSQFLDGIDSYLAHTPLPPGECIDWIREKGLEKFWPGIWNQPDAMRGKRQDQYKYTSKRSRDLVHKLKGLHSGN